MENYPEVEKYTDSSLMLSNAVENSELILNYATESGLEIREDWVETIIAAKRCDDKKIWDTATEIKFWMAYKGMSKLIQPVSVDSLRATKMRKVTKPNLWQKLFKIKVKASFSKHSVQQYLTWATVWIIVMLIVQVFTLKGTTLLNTIQINKKTISDIDFRMGEVRLMIKADETNERAILERYRLETEKGKLDEEIRGSIDLLRPWVYTIRKLTSVNRLFQTKKQNEVLSKKEELQVTEGPGSGPPGEIAPEVENVDYINIVQEAQNFTQILQLYILPLLYGLIGGFVFVLRGLVFDIKNRIFSQYSNIKYSLRIHLGAIAGLIVGLLWGDIESQQITFLQSLSTAGIAFIAGYGIEYLFNGLDKLIGAIGKLEDSPKQETK
jgi:hypothetical protein